MAAPRGQEEWGSFARLRWAVRVVALSFPRYLLGCKRAAGDSIFLLDGGSQEGQWLLLGALVPLLLLQLHAQLLHVPLLLLQLPGELIDDLLLLHQHFVLLRVQPIQLRRHAAPVQAAHEAFLGAEVHGGRVEAEGG